MGKRNPIGAEEIYVQVKRTINDVVRVVWALRDQRAQDEYEDDRDQDAYDALEDMCLITGEMCGLWDRLWASVGQGRPDTIPWVRRDFEQLDPETHDPWLERQKRYQAAADLRRAIEEECFDEESIEGADDSDERELAEPLDERELGSDGADSESVA